MTLTNRYDRMGIRADKATTSPIGMYCTAAYRDRNGIPPIRRKMAMPNRFRFDLGMIE